MTSGNVPQNSLASQGDVAQAAFSAVDQLANKATVPLIVEENGRAGIWGTGTLFRIGGSHFLITARHVAVALGSGKVGVPVDGGRKTVLCLGRGTIASNDICDVAVFRIEESDPINRLMAAWEFLTLDNVSTDSLSEDSAFLLYGYPTESAQLTAGTLNATPLAYIASLYRGSPAGFKSPFEPTVDLLLAHSVQAVNRHTLESASLPDLPGISGCSVWEIPNPNAGANQIWTPRNNTRIVAIETSCLSGEWIRCRKWAVIKGLVDSLLADGT